MRPLLLAASILSLLPVATRGRGVQGQGAARAGMGVESEEDGGASPPHHAQARGRYVDPDEPREPSRPHPRSVRWIRGLGLVRPPERVHLRRRRGERPRDNGDGNSLELSPGAVLREHRVLRRGGARPSSRAFRARARSQEDSGQPFLLDFHGGRTHVIARELSPRSHLPRSMRRESFPRSRSPSTTSATAPTKSFRSSARRASSRSPS